MLLSKVLTQEMEQRNLSIEDISECSGVSVQKLNQYVKGKVSNKKDLNLICEAVGIDPNDIVFSEMNISLNEASRMLGKHPNFIKAMVKNGVFGFYDGSTYHIPLLKVEQYMGLRSSPDMKELVGLLSYAIYDIVNKQKADLNRKPA